MIFFEGCKFLAGFFYFFGLKGFYSDDYGEGAGWTPSLAEVGLVEVGFLGGTVGVADDYHAGVGGGDGVAEEVIAADFGAGCGGFDAFDGGSAFRFEFDAVVHHSAVFTYARHHKVNRILTFFQEGRGEGASLDPMTACLIGAAVDGGIVAGKAP